MRCAEALWLCALVSSSACQRASAADPGNAGQDNERSTPAPAVLERAFEAGRQGEWRDYGWAERATVAGGPERLDVGGHGGWILVNFSLHGPYGGLTFRVRAPGVAGDWLQVRLDSATVDIFPRVDIRAAHRRALAGGWVEVFVPMLQLNPTQVPFDRVVLRARAALPRGTLVDFDGVGLTVPGPDVLAEALVEGTPAAFDVSCAGASHPISPLIYGIAFSPLREYESEQQWALGATARRWGGNPASRYNWELGNAWNTGADYFFENVNYTRRPDFSWETFFATQRRHGVRTALTVPTLGWVARDTKRFSFPVSEFGAQQHVDPDEPEAGNGVSKAGVVLEPSAPLRTSVAASAEFIERWVRAIRAHDAKLNVRSVDQYILDNEPMLWNDTQRDVHPAPTSYDELLEKTIAYGSAVRRADPDALIAGPAEWGWSGYFWSAVDAKAGFRARPDRRAHGDMALVPWLLSQVAAHQKRTGVRVLDVLDLHFYPQGKGVGVGQDGATDAATSALRLRSTRALWDPTYVDESWIAEPIALLPRMQQWVDENDPGLKLSLGEYSFGAERHPSGGLALAEALGRFGQSRLYSAFYWTYPAEGTPASWAFRAYRDYDGHGAHFGEFSLGTTAVDGASLFASRDERGGVVTLVALNLSSSVPREASVQLLGCAPITSRRVFTWAGDPRGFTEVPAGGKQTYRLAPWSITVIELKLAQGPAR